MRRPVVSAFCFLLSAFPLAATNATRVTLAWDSPNCTNPITGYNLYSGPSSRTYTNVVHLVATNQGTLPVIRYGRTFIAATAVDSFGFESDYSNEICWTNFFPPKTNLLITVTTPGPSLLRGPSLAGPWTNLNLRSWTATNPPAPPWFRGAGATNKIAIRALPFWTSPTNDVPY